MDPDYLESSPYFTKAAMEWILAKKPSILGGDSARWDNLQDPQGFFVEFYEADILMLAPLVNLEAVTAPRCKLTALPLKAVRTSCAPARVVIVED
jgi:kynurenine formamidase